MTTALAGKPAEAEIRELIDSYARAMQAKDVDAIMAHYAPEIVAYDAIAALQFKDIAGYRAHWQACLAMCPGPMLLEQHEVKIAASGDLAFAHCLSRCGTVDADGKEQASWMRMTACYRRTAAGWRIVHEHFSAPFDVASGKALFELQP